MEVTDQVADAYGNLEYIISDDITNILGYIGNRRSNRILNPEIDGTPSLDTAYNTLLDSRNKNMYAVDTSGILTEDDKVCDINLRTSTLFKGYSERYKKLSNELENLLNDEKVLEESIQRMQTNILEIKGVCMAYKKDLIDPIQKNHTALYDSIVSMQTSVKSEIGKLKMTLDFEMDKLSNKLESLRKVIVTGISEIVDPVDANNKKMCPVCFDREVDIAMVPCGHTCCSGCSSHHHTNKCMQCRTVIRTRVKIYFSV